MTFPFRRPIELIGRPTQTGVDDYGDPVYDTPTKTVLGAFDPGTSGETEQAASSDPMLYLPPGTDVSWTSQARVDGVTYEVNGQPGAWQHGATGWNAGVVVRLKTTIRPPA